jgi:hypothetical protein
MTDPIFGVVGQSRCYVCNSIVDLTDALTSEREAMETKRLYHLESDFFTSGRDGGHDDY